MCGACTPRLRLSPDNCAILKGGAILAIVLHNFFHFAIPVRENQFEFSTRNLQAFLPALVDPRTTLGAIFAFLGHYGVQVFIFLSAYGLATKYWDTPAGLRFLWGRVQKIYPTFLLAIIGWALICGIAGGPLEVWSSLQTNAFHLVLILAGVSTLLPGYDLPPIGPWWFVAFIMQWYAVWPAVRRLAKWHGPRGLVALSIGAAASTHLANVVLLPLHVNLLETPVGHMPELCLGIAAARFEVRINAFVALPCILVMVLGNAVEWLWPATFICALVVVLWMWQRIRIPGRQITARLGACALPLFLVNGFVRFPFLFAIPPSRPWYSILGLGLASTVCSWGLAELMPRAPKRGVSLRAMMAETLSCLCPLFPSHYSMETGPTAPIAQDRRKMPRRRAHSPGQFL